MDFQPLGVSQIGNAKQGCPILTASDLERFDDPLVSVETNPAVDIGSSNFSANQLRVTADPRMPERIGNC